MSKLKEHAAPILIMLLLMVLAFHEAPSHSLLINWDDQDYITKNPAIRGFTLQNLKLAFTSYYVGNYAPVQIVSYMLDYSLWGMKPSGFLSANLAYHFLSGVVLYFLLIRQGFWKWGAWFGSALFLIHPVQVESVVWASQRKNLLAMLFCLLAFHAWLGYRERKGKGTRVWYAASVLLFILALLAKSVAVIFPVMLILYDVLIPPVRRRVGDHADKIPFLCAALAVGILAIMTQVPDHGGGRVNYPDNLALIPTTMLPVLASYLAKLVWPSPADLCVMYFPPTRFSIDAAVMISAGLAVCLVLLGVYLYRKKPACFFWYGLFFLGLLPVSQIIPLVTLMNDRYLYFPMVGVAGVTAYLFTAVQKTGWSPRLSRIAVCLALPLLVLLAHTSYVRGKVWQDSISLFSDAVIKVPNQPDPWSRLAEGYVSIGNLVAAQAYYERSASLGELDNEAKFNLAQIYLDRGEFTKAHDFINNLLAADRKFKEAQFFLGEYYYRIGAFHDAEGQLLSYLRGDPDSVAALMTLGQVYVMLGRHDTAREYYARAVGTGGGTPTLYYAMASLESIDKNIDLSLAYLHRALRLGFNKYVYLQQDPSLENVRRDPRFGALVSRIPR
ncbi:MAG: tetratricopeptide repeat protein [Desulfobacteraceae bacterium]|nr:tetratricopeptide repeat protein [Desulfobacteraceae bacterium]